MMTETEFESESYASCSYARHRNGVRTWLEMSAVLVEMNAAAEGGSPALMANSSLMPVEPREGHVPGNYSLA